MGSLASGQVGWIQVRLLLGTSMAKQTFSRGLPALGIGSSQAERHSLWDYKFVRKMVINKGVI
jgi:hypothetical protein